MYEENMVEDNNGYIIYIDEDGTYYSIYEDAFHESIRFLSVIDDLESTKYVCELMNDDSYVVKCDALAMLKDAPANSWIQKVTQNDTIFGWAMICRINWKPLTLPEATRLLFKMSQ
jgi:hypothetical protein